MGLSQSEVKGTEAVVSEMGRLGSWLRRAPRRTWAEPPAATRRCRAMEKGRRRRRQGSRRGRSRSRAAKIAPQTRSLTPHEEMALPVETGARAARGEAAISSKTDKSDKLFALFAEHGQQRKREIQAYQNLALRESQASAAAVASEKKVGGRSFSQAAW